MKKLALILFFSFLTINIFSQALQLSKPSSGVIWPAFSIQRIEWISVNIDNIKIESSLDSGRTWTIIQTSYPASASFYEWTVPNFVSDSCYIRISDVLNAATYSSNFKASPFKIPAAGINLDSLPTSITANTVMPITWVSSGVKKVNLYISLDNKTSFKKIADTITANNFYYNWIVPDTVASNCFIRIENKDQTALADTSHTAFNIVSLTNGTAAKYKGGSFDGHASANNNAKRIIVNAPNNVDSLFGSTVYSIQWKQNNIERVRLQYSPDNGASWQTIITDYPAFSEKYSWTVPNTPTILGRIKITDALDSTIYDISDSNFIVRKKILKITQPDSTSIVYKQTALPISWNSGGVTLLKVHILYGSKDSVLRDSLPANYESINWVVSSIMADSFRIVLSDRNDSTLNDTTALIQTKYLPNAVIAKYHGGSFDGHSMSANSSSKIQLSTPSGGEKLSVLNTFQIRWKSNNVERVSLDFSSDSGKTWTLIAADIAASATAYAWKTTNQPSANCLVRIRNALDSSIFDICDSVFTLSSKHLSNTTDSLNWVKGTAKSIEWLPFGVDTIKVLYKFSANENWKLLRDSVPSSFQTMNWVLPTSLADSVWIRMLDISDSTVKDDKLYTGNMQGLVQGFDAVKYHGGSFDGHSQRSNINKLIIKRPDANEIIVSGTNYSITWSTINLEDSVWLQYSIDSGATWTTIARTMSDLGVYQWQLPTTFSIKDRPVMLDSINKTVSFSINGKMTMLGFVPEGSSNSVYLNKCLIRALDISSGNAVVGASNKPFTITTNASINKSDIIFPKINDTTYATNIFLKLKAANTTGRPIQYSLKKGPAQIKNDTLFINNPGSVTVAAITLGDSVYLPSDTAFQTFCVNPARPAIINNGKSSFCTGDSILLSSSSASWNQWYVDSNQISGAVSKNYVARKGGNYQLINLVDGCFSAYSQSILLTENALPSLPVIANTRPLTFCIGDSTILTSSATSGNQWLLNGTNINGSIAQSITVKLAGVYTVQNTNTAGCSSSSLKDTVTVNTLPAIPTITNNRPLVFCNGDSTVLTSSSSTNNQWLLNGININAAIAQSIIVKLSGNYAVRITNNSGCSATSLQDTVLVNAIPSAPTITNNRPLTFCSGDSTLLTSSAASGNQWLLNGNAITGATGTAYTVKAAGNYSVIATNGNCVSPVSTVVAIIVNTLPPVPTITYSRPLSFCNGDSTVLSSSSLSNNQWLLNGSFITGGTNAFLTASIGGSYSVKNTNANGCFAISVITTVVVNNNPAKPVITQNGNQLITAAGQNTYQWFLNNLLILNATNNVYFPVKSGNYQVTVTNSSGCAATSDAFSYVVTAISPVTGGGDKISISPNPSAGGESWLVFEQQPAYKNTVNIFSSGGSLLHSFTTISQRTKLPISNLVQGLYFIKVIGKQGTTTLTLIVK